MNARDAVRSLDVEPIGCDQELVVRDDAHEAAQRAVMKLGDPRLDEEVRELVGGYVVAQEQEPDQHREAIGLDREPAPVHLQVDVGEDRLAGRVQPPSDPGAGVARRCERLAQPSRAAGRRRGGRRLQTLRFFDLSQPPCTGASREPSAFWGA